MHNIANKYARASEIAAYYLCPRLVYFQRRRERALSDAGARAGVFKALSHALSSVVAAACPEAALDAAIRQACSDSLLVYGPAYEQAIVKASREARERAPAIVAGLLREKSRVGERGLTGLISPASIAVTVYSDKLCMSGTIDKVVRAGDSVMPVILSASLPPESGIFGSDRVRLAAYALLLAEKYGVDCRDGAVEYVPGWCVRPAQVRHEDKRKALYARNRVLDMNEGRMPDAIRGKWCGRCEYGDACNVKATPLDSLFKKIGKV